MSHASRSLALGTRREGLRRPVRGLRPATTQEDVLNFISSVRAQFLTKNFEIELIQKIYSRVSVITIHNGITYCNIKACVKFDKSIQKYKNKLHSTIQLTAGYQSLSNFYFIQVSSIYQTNLLHQIKVQIPNGGTERVWLGPSESSECN